jgi:hypothetical protein
MNSNTYDKLSDDVINQIEDFPIPKTYATYPFYDNLTQEQKSLIDELIPNEELRERYKKYGLCKECSQPNTGSDYIHPGANLVTPNIFNKILTNGPVAIKKLMNLYKIFN